MFFSFFLLLVKSLENRSQTAALTVQSCVCLVASQFSCIQWVFFPNKVEEGSLTARPTAIAAWRCMRWCWRSFCYILQEVVGCWRLPRGQGTFVIYWVTPAATSGQLRPALVISIDINCIWQELVPPIPLPPGPSSPNSTPLLPCSALSALLNSSPPSSAPVLVLLAPLGFLATASAHGKALALDAPVLYSFSF